MKSSTTLLATLLMLGAAGTITPAQANPRLTNTPMQLAQSSVPTTYMTAQGPNDIVVQISDGDFYFRNTMHRTYGNLYQATDHGVRVMFDQDSSRVTVISERTGEEFYNYFFTGSVGSAGSGSSSATSYGSTPAESYIVQVNDNEYSAILIDGQFYFEAPLSRTSGEMFIGTSGRFRVMYDRSSGRVVVINASTGDELYNYIYSEADEGYL